MPQSTVRYAWYVASLLTAINIVSYLDRFLPSLLVPAIKQDLHLTDFQIGLLLGPAFSLFFITLGIPVGWLADRFSRRTIVAAGVTILVLYDGIGRSGDELSDAVSHAAGRRHWRGRPWRPQAYP